MDTRTLHTTCNNARLALCEKCDATRCPGVRMTVGWCPAGIFIPTLNLAAIDAVSPGTSHAGNAVKRAALAGEWGE